MWWSLWVKTEGHVCFSYQYPHCLCNCIGSRLIVVVIAFTVTLNPTLAKLCSVNCLRWISSLWVIYRLSNINLPPCPDGIQRGISFHSRQWRRRCPRSFLLQFTAAISLTVDWIHIHIMHIYVGVPLWESPAYVSYTVGLKRR